MGLLEQSAVVRNELNELQTKIRGFDILIDRITDPQNRGYMMAVKDQLEGAIVEHRRTVIKLLDIIDEHIKIEV